MWLIFFLFVFNLHLRFRKKKNNKCIGWLKDSSNKMSHTYQNVSICSFLQRRGQTNIPRVLVRFWQAFSRIYFRSWSAFSKIVLRFWSAFSKVGLRFWSAFSNSLSFCLTSLKSETYKIHVAKCKHLFLLTEAGANKYPQGFSSFLTDFFEDILSFLIGFLEDFFFVFDRRFRRLVFVFDLLSRICFIFCLTSLKYETYNMPVQEFGHLTIQCT